MTSLSAVKLAMKRGKNDDALYLLRKVMRQQRTAEAHYLAAKLAPNPIMARKQLQCAIDLDPTYEAAHVMLQLIERETASQTQTGKLRADLLDTFSEDTDDTEGGYVERMKKWMFAQSR